MLGTLPGIRKPPEISNEIMNDLICIIPIEGDIIAAVSVALSRNADVAPKRYISEGDK